MAERLFGVETEYAITGLEGGSSLDREWLVERMLEVAKKQLPHLPDLHSSGLYLSNGARFYVDCGLHPEFCTPECANPWDVVRYIRAGEEILANILSRVQEGERKGREVLCFRCNVDYGGGKATWGCHESYLHRAPPATLSEQIIPHLVTRVIYTGAGGFNPLSPAVEFSLSPRAAHIVCVVSGSSTDKRGIFHTKDESLCGPGYHRLHVLCGESLCSEIAAWLKVGVTALVVAMIEAGLKPGAAVRLQAPLEALRTVATDVRCQAPLQLAHGGASSALAIQRHYLEQAERHAGDDFMPPWAAEACRRWRAMLDRLEGAPESVETTLDWAMKRALYLDHVRRRGVSWGALGQWSSVLRKLQEALPAGAAGRLEVDFLISPHSPVLEEAAALTPYLRERGLRWGDLNRLGGLRAELLEIDTRFGQLGSQGIFRSLERDAPLTHHVPGVDNIEHAMAYPPALGRGRLRGEAVRQLAAEKKRGHCDWQAVWDDSEKRLLDLSDPFLAEPRWQGAAHPPGEAEAGARSGFVEFHRGLLRFLDLRR